MVRAPRTNDDEPVWVGTTLSCRSSLGFKLQYRECHNDGVAYLFYSPSRPDGCVRMIRLLFFLGWGIDFLTMSQNLRLLELGRICLD